MGEFNFYKAWSILRELGEPPLGAPPGGSPPPGGGMPPPGGGMPPMGGGMPPMGGGGGLGGPPMGGMGDPMGGGMGGGQPIPVKTISAADVWGILEKIVKSDRFDRFFDEISINKPTEAQVFTKDKKQSSLRQ